MADIWFDVDTAIAEAPINLLPLIDDTDFKTREEALTYDQAGLDLVWNFVTTAGAMTQTAVTPTESAGDYDWTNEGNGMYAIEIPASSGASINNDTEGFGWFTGYATGVLPWRGPVIGFRAAGLNNVLIDSAYSATRGLAGTALPDAAADAAGGLVISDDGGLDIDTMYDGIVTNATGADVATDVAAVLADTGTDGVVVASIANNAITAAAIADAAIDAATFAADVDAEVATYVWNAATASYGGAGTYGQAVEDVLADTGTDGVLIAADAITASIFDESTAFPLTSADSGSTAVARTGADGDTLEDLSDEIASVQADISALATTADIADAVADEALSGHTTAGTVGQTLTDIVTDTAEIGSAGAGLTAVPWNSAWDAEVESEVDDALGGGTGTALTAIPWNSAWDAEVQSECADAITAASLPTAVEAAQELLETNLGAGTDSEARSVRNALRVLRNKVANATGTMTVYKEDDSTSAWTATLTQDSNANPIITIDPS